MKASDFSYYLTSFLTTYMSGQRNASINTIKTYRDAFKLFLIFCKVKYLLINVDYSFLVPSNFYLYKNNLNENI